jgi:hypothetical protein
MPSGGDPFGFQQRWSTLCFRGWIIVFDAVYDRFRKLLVEKAQALNWVRSWRRFGPVINAEQLGPCWLRSAGSL